jgi:GLPGLI family protein
MGIHLRKIMNMKLLYTLFLGLMFIQLSAQSEGVIVYEEKVDVHKRLPPERQEYKDMIPQFRTQKFELHYNESASMYVSSKDQDQPEMGGGGGGGGHGHGMMRMSRPDRDVYKNLEENKLVDSREFMSKKFLIKGALDDATWKIADGQKQILDYLCLKAVYQDTADTYVAWFTPQITIGNGPAEYSGLPGMILQIVVNDNDRVITALSVTEQKVEQDMLKEPKKGKEVTSEEYKIIVQEKMKEMGQGGNNGTFIHVRRN